MIDTSKDVIDYGMLIDDAMHVIVKKCLEKVVANNSKLPGAHHFFITFLTKYPGVKLSQKMKERYPDEMTIVLQYQFEELIVENHFFSVVLSFDGEKQKVVVPFSSLTSFADPSSKFGLQFRRYDIEGYDEFSGEDDFVIEEQEGAQIELANNIVHLDAFRGKRRK